jgi:hypothetical protein
MPTIDKPKPAYVQCRVCGKYGWTDTHVCAPEWEWRSDDLHDKDEWSGRLVRAHTAEMAAALAGEVYDEGERELVRGGEATIWVRRIGEADVTKWTITAEAVPEYYANPADEDPEG